MSRHRHVQSKEVGPSKNSGVPYESRNGIWQKQAMKKASSQGPVKVGPHTTIDVADTPLRVKVAESPDDLDRWIEDLDQYASAFLRNDLDRPGAAELHRIRKLAQDMRAAIGNRNARAATFAGMTLLNATWMAMIRDGKVMLDAGVKAYRRGNAANRVRSEKAAATYDTWQSMVPAIRAKHPNWKKSEVARQIARDTGDQFETIRKNIILK